jgi:glycosyltransferase involved in cell wall biosynthesis
VGGASPLPRHRVAVDVSAEHGAEAVTTRRLHVVIVVPGFVLDRDDQGMPAVVDLVERLAAIHDCDVVALRYPPARPAYRVAGASVRTLGLGSSGGPIGRAVVLARGVRAVLAIDRRRPIDVVHGLWADEPGAVATITGRLLRRPVAVSLMGGELVGLPDIGYGAALGRGGRWTTAIALRGTDLVTAGSEATLRSVLDRRPGARAVLAPLGVDLAMFRPDRRAAAAGSSDRPATLLFAGSLEPVKDPALALRVFAALTLDRPGLRFDVVGEGRLRGDLERLAAGLGVADRTRFVGQVPRAEMPARLRAASLLLVTSRHEGQSMVAVEAAASGIPVVGTRVGVLPDLGGGATAVPTGDEAALVAAVAAVLDDPARAVAMGVAGRSVAVARYDLDRTAADITAHYETLLSRRAGPSSER